MNGERVERRLAAILAADVASYSRLMGADEEGTLAALKAIRRELGDPKIAAYRGRIVKTTGDGLLVEFASVVDAVRCAVDVQRGMAERNADIPRERRIEFRIGINVGDVIIDGDDLYGDGVNIAARLEALAPAGGICVSARVHEDAINKVEAAFEDLGEQSLKNISRAVRAYRVRAASEATAAEPTPLPNKPSNAEPASGARSAEQKMRRIGYVGVEPRKGIEEFRRRLAAYGHIESKTVQVHYRWSGGVYAKYPEMVDELIALEVELIVAAATPAVAAAKQGTRTLL
jgi:class 3 adenylate cyclase